MTYKEFLALNPYHGMPVTCKIYGKKITDAKLSKNENGKWYVCQNEKEGSQADDKIGYNYSWIIFSGNKGEYEEIDDETTNLQPLHQHKFSGLKVGDLLQKNGNFRAVLDIRHLEHGELALVDLSKYSKDKNNNDLKRHDITVTFFELEENNYKIFQPEPTPTITPEQQQAIDMVNQLADQGKIKSKVELVGRPNIKCQPI